MYHPSPTASLPHALAVAHQGLCESLDLGIQEFKQYHRFSNAGQISLAIERFVDEFCRVPEWRAQLEWRAEFVESNTGLGSAYWQAMDAALKACRDLPKKPLGLDFLIEGQRFSSLLRSTAPLVLAPEVDVLRENLEAVVDTRVLNSPVQGALEEWLHQCRLIQSEAQHLQAHGCHYLYHVYQAVKPDASEWSEWRRAELASETFFGGALLEPMRVAADSLVAWAAEHGALAAVRDDVQTNASKGSGKNSKRRRGSKGPRYDREQDKGIYDGWQRWRNNGGDRSIEKYAKEKHGATTRKEILEIDRAIAREWKRRRRKGQK